MFRKWLSNLVNEVLSQQLLSIHTLLGEVLMNQAKILNRVEELSDHLMADKQPGETPAHDGSGIQASPVQTTRQSWPRMKRHLEERDVRKIIAEQQQSFDNQNAGRIANKFNEEAAKLEAYWREKSASVKE